MLKPIRFIVTLGNQNNLVRNGKKENKKKTNVEKLKRRRGKKHDRPVRRKGRV